jgi:hypothetical protein
MMSELTPLGRSKADIAQAPLTYHDLERTAWNTFHMC